MFERIEEIVRLAEHGPVHISSRDLAAMLPTDGERQWLPKHLENYLNSLGMRLWYSPSDDSYSVRAEAAS
jgi:hypothetical protein